MRLLIIILLIFCIPIFSTSCSNNENDITRVPGISQMDEDDEVLNMDDSSIVNMSNVAARVGISGAGILWKPVADSDGKLVILLHRSWGKPSVKVYNKIGANKYKFSESGKFVYFSNPDRATYRFNKPGGAFSNPCLLVVGNNYYVIKNPHKRQE